MINDEQPIGAGRFYLLLVMVLLVGLVVGNYLPPSSLWGREHTDLESEIEKMAETQAVSQAESDMITLTEAIKEKLGVVPGEVEAFLFPAIYHIVRYAGIECAAYVAFLDPDTDTVNLFEIGERYECSDPIN